MNLTDSITMLSPADRQDQEDEIIVLKSILNEEDGGGEDLDLEAKEEDGSNKLMHFIKTPEESENTGNFI